MVHVSLVLFLILGLAITRPEYVAVELLWAFCIYALSNEKLIAKRVA